MIEKALKEQGENNIQSFIKQWTEKTGCKPTDVELCIYKLGLSTGICLAGVGLANSTINFNE